MLLYITSKGTRRYWVFVKEKNRKEKCCEPVTNPKAEKKVKENVRSYCDDAGR